MPTRLPKHQSDKNAWVTLNNFHNALKDCPEYLYIVTNSNNPPTIKQYSRFIWYNTESITLSSAVVTGNNEYSSGASVTSNISQAIFEDGADRTFSWGSGNFPAISDGTWYLECRGSTDTNSTTIGKGSYSASTTAPTYQPLKGGWYNASGYKVLARFTVASSVVSNLVVLSKPLNEKKTTDTAVSTSDLITFTDVSDSNIDKQATLTNMLAGNVVESSITLADNTTNNSSTSNHGFLKKLSNTATEFMDGTGAWDSVKDSDLSTSDITTNDVSTSKHGFAPKAPNDATKYLDGTGAYSVPTGAGLAKFASPQKTGLLLSRASTTTIGITSGYVIDSTGADALYISSAFTKSTSSWAVGTGNGGLDTGSIANSTWYSVWVIKRPDTGVNDVLLSTSATAPTMPANYTLKKRIGWVLTNGSAQFVVFFENVEGEFIWDVKAIDVNETISVTTRVLKTMTAPIGVNGLFNVFYYQTAGSVAIDIGWTGRTNAVASQTAMTLTSTITAGQSLQVKAFVDSSHQIFYRSDSGLGTLVILTEGWVDKV
jgi:hypothetical protein